MNEETKATQENNENRGHHNYSPSTLQNTEACPLYQSRQVVHIRAIIGTLAHGVTETRRDDDRLSDEDASAAAECIDFYDNIKQQFEDYRKEAAIKKIHKSHGLTPGVVGEIANFEEKLEKELADTPPIKEFVEDYLPVDDCIFEDVITDLTTGEHIVDAKGKPKFTKVKHTSAGYLDRGIISHDGKDAVLIDWKFGMWPVEDAENNTQGIAYSLGVFKAFPTVEKVTFIFKQPLLEHVSKAVFTRDMVPALYLRIQTIVARAREARNSGKWDMANPMVPVCNFCAKIGRCEKVASVMLKIASKFDPLKVPESITPTQLHDPAKAREALLACSVAKVWSEAFKTQVTNQVLSRDMEAPEGYALTSRSDRDITDKKLFRKAALEAAGEEALEEATSYTFGPVEKAVNDAAPRGTKKEAVETFKDYLVKVGAVTKSDPYTFLRAVAAKKKKK